MTRKQLQITVLATMMLRRKSRGPWRRTGSIPPARAWHVTGLCQSEAPALEFELEACPIQDSFWREPGPHGVPGSCEEGGLHQAGSVSPLSLIPRAQKNILKPSCGVILGMKTWDTGLHKPSSPLRGSHSRSRPHTWPFSKASSPHPEPVHPLLPEATARVRTSSSPGPSVAETSHLVSWPLLNDLNSAHTRGPLHVLSLSPARTICWSRAEAASFGRDLYPPLPYRCTTPIHHHTYDVIFSEGRKDQIRPFLASASQGTMSVPERATCKPLGAQRPRLTRQLGRARHRRRSNLPRSCSDMEPQPGFLTPLLPYQADAQVGKLRPREEAVPGKQAGQVPHRDQKSNKISRPGQRSPRWTLVTLPLGRRGREHADLSPEQPVLSPRGSC
ncbi:uncharacterized protein [Symphalangus syndactylus]|uniref:uncharacterized protein n=1 Tax=Symphalangus syndactylus TaxID=9590 RepID=UPI003006DAA0